MSISLHIKNDNAENIKNEYGLIAHRYESLTQKAALAREALDPVDADDIDRQIALISARNKDKAVECILY